MFEHGPCHSAYGSSEYKIRRNNNGLLQSENDIESDDLPKRSELYGGGHD